MLCLYFSVPIYAQHDWEEHLNELLEVDEMDETAWETMYERLCELEEHPLNVNQATREDWEGIPFLTEQEVEAICLYFHRYGSMKSLGELAMIPALDYNKRELLSYFVYLGEESSPQQPSLKELIQRGRHQVMGTVKIPTYERKGFRDGYLGSRYKHQIRYDFHSGEQLRAGFIGAQDAGEPFFSGNNRKGYDHYAGYVMLRNRGWLKTLALGHYRIGWGMGLVMNSNFAMGKLAMLQQMGRVDNGIRPHASAMSGSYLQGMAGTVELFHNLELTIFLSWRQIDGTMNRDSSSISSINTSGYHRTLTEMNRKNNTEQFTTGLRMTYRWQGIHIGASVLYTTLSRELLPRTSTVYRRYYPQGRHFVNMGVDYGYNGSRWSLNGETALDKNGALSTINQVSYRLASDWRLMALQRFYSKRYESLFAQSFSEGGRIQNESGVYVGAQWQPSRVWSFAAYTDYAYFPWPRYQVSWSSHAWDNVLNIVCAPKQWRFTVRYRLRLKERDHSSDDVLVDIQEHRLRTTILYDATSWNTKTQADLVMCHGEENSKGWMVTQQIGWRPTPRLQIDGAGGYFRTDDYNSRVYGYERGMRYSFNYPSYYGEGIRYWLLVKWVPSNHLQVTGKVGTTNYFDRSKIGSSYQEIDHSSMTDIELQLCWKP